MTQPLLQILKDIQWGLVAFFWPIWAALTVTTAVGAAWAVGHAASPISQGAQGRPINPSRRPFGPGGAVTAVTILAVMLLGYGVVTFMWEDFANWDESVFYAFHAQGQRCEGDDLAKGWTFLAARLPRIQLDTPFH